MSEPDRPGREYFEDRANGMRHEAHESHHFATGSTVASGVLALVGIEAVTTGTKLGEIVGTAAFMGSAVTGMIAKFSMGDRAPARQSTERYEELAAEHPPLD